MPQFFKWTVSIIVQQDGEHLFEYVELEQSILNQKYNKDIRYIIFYYDQGTGKNFIKQLVYNPQTKLSQFDKLRDWVIQDIYSTATLVSFFQEYVLKDSISQYNMVFLWGHGAGMGYFSAVDQEPNKSNFLNGLEEDFDFFSKRQKYDFNSDLNSLAFYGTNFSYPLLGNDFVDSLLNYFTKKYQVEKIEDKFSIKGISAKKRIKDLINARIRLISVKNLASILETSFSKDFEKVDVLITLNCYTQTVETCHELSKKVDMLIAPQTTMPFAGWNYHKLFEYLVEKQYTPVGLAENLRDNFLIKYETEPFATQFKQRWPNFDVNVVSFSGNNLSVMKDLAENISAIAIILKESLLKKLGVKYEGLQIVMGARARCEDVTPSNNFDLIDLTHFLEECIFFVDQEESQIASLVTQFKSLKENTIAANLLPLKLFKPPGSPKPSASPNFLSIFFPYRSGGGGKFSKFILENFYNDKSANACSFLNHKWDEFICSPEIPK